MKWKESSHGSGLWFRQQGDAFEMMIVFVDDINYAGPSYEHGERFFDELCKEYNVQLEYERNPKKYIGYNIEYDKYEKGSISISASDYNRQLVEKYNGDGKLPKRMMPSDPSVSFRTLEAEMRNNGSDKKEDISKSKKLVGELLYQAGLQCKTCE